LASFTSEVKKEIIQTNEAECCSRAELMAMIRMNGVISTLEYEMMLDIQTESAATARRIYTLLKKLHNYDIEIIVRKKIKLNKNNIYIVRTKQHVKQLLDELQLEHEDDGFIQISLKEEFHHKCCKRAYLRGAFVSRGSVNNPETSSYHLEIFNLDQDHNHVLCELMNEFHLNARELQRRNGYIVYIKEAEKIADFINLIGAKQALFKFEDIRIVRDMRNSVNRIVNCETANLNKTISASVRQIENIKLIQEKEGLDILPDRLKEIAMTRLQHPEISLKELGELLPSGKLSKSGVNHRLKKIEQIAMGMK